MPNISLFAVEEFCPPSTVERLGEQKWVNYKHFRSTDDLQKLLMGLDPSPIVIHAAAVSDYKPIRQHGKISSNQEHLTIELERTPKIISGLRDHYGPKAFLVGFKLLSGVSTEELIAAGIKQLQDNRLNMVIANDLTNLKDGNHPVLVLTAEGGVLPYEGSREEVVRDLANLIHTRENVHWFRSVHNPGIKPSLIGEAKFNTILDFVKATHLLTDNSGNISVRGDGDLQVSPRGIDKSTLSPDHAVPVVPSIETGILNYGNARTEEAKRPGRELKPSIDTGMEAMLYEAFREVDAIIHFHKGWGVMEYKTSYPFPCGVGEEAEEVIDSIPSNRASGLSVELMHHGFLLGITMKEFYELESQWQQALEEFDTHLQEVSKEGSPELDKSFNQPIWDKAKIVGVVHANPQGAVVYITEANRGGKAKAIVQQLIDRQYTIQTVDDCHVRDFYKRYGFSETESNGVYGLTPPKNVLRREF